MAKKFPTHPAHPERVSWGCDKYCPADALMCGNGTLATPHPSELFGEDWLVGSGCGGRPSRRCVDAGARLEALTAADVYLEAAQVAA